MDTQTNAPLQLAFDFVQYTGQHIFLTGKAGTGKTTFLHNLKLKSPKRMIVVAPTGVAAINAGGVTIHSFFQLSFGPQVGAGKEQTDQIRFSREKINILRSLDLLVIDEISMVRADLLDAIDGVLRRFKDRSKPFGGVQMLMIGDLQQLSPVVKDDEWSLLKAEYDTIYFFSSKALRQTSFVSIELTHVYRQQDDFFISILNKVRENRLDQTSLEALNKRYIPNFTQKEGYITLCTHNAQAQRINELQLLHIPAKANRYMAVLEGKFPEYSYPTDFELYLKVDAQVMFVKNDTSYDKLFYNGKIGKITRIDEGTIYVQCPDDKAEIPVTPLKWDNVKYTIDPQTNEIKETVEGSFTQYPLKLAWAITIHKSQGLTFERAIIDAEASFAHGQVYVALSRCKTLEGMVLSTPISNRSIISDGTISSFIHQIEQHQPDSEWLDSAKLAYQHELLSDLFRFNRTRYLVNVINKQMDENAGSVPQLLIDYFREMSIAVQTQIVDVAEKFHGQIAQLLVEQPDVERNAALQNRIVKAAGYFVEKINAIITESLSRLDLDVDNKALRKQLLAATVKLEEEIIVKVACLTVCLEGFDVKKVLDTRAVALLEKEKPKEKEPRKFSELQDTDIKHPILYNILRAWRKAKAEELNVAVFMIFSQKALFELATYLPTDVKTLKQINGLGSRKIDQFGADIVEIIEDYCMEYKVEQPQISLKPFTEKKSNTGEPKQPKEDTKLVSFNLFKEGKNMEQIAQERGVTVATVEKHLGYFVTKGELDVSLFVTDDKLKKISAYFSKAPDRSLSLAKETLGEQVTYTEIRMVLNHLDYLADLNK
jgi:hypothetical protein